MTATRAWMLTFAASVSLTGCTMLDSYGGLSVGYGDSDDGYYSGSYYGWYDNLYYPGAGAWVYDRDGKRQAWSEKHRSYWEARRAAWHGKRDMRENWSEYRHERGERRAEWRGERGEDREHREGRRERNGGDHRGGDGAPGGLRERRDAGEHGRDLALPRREGGEALAEAPPVARQPRPTPVRQVEQPRPEPVRQVQPQPAQRDDARLRPRPLRSDTGPIRED